MSYFNIHMNKPSNTNNYDFIVWEDNQDQIRRFGFFETLVLSVSEVNENVHPDKLVINWVLEKGMMATDKVKEILDLEELELNESILVEDSNEINFQISFDCIDNILKPGNKVLKGNPGRYDIIDCSIKSMIIHNEISDKSLRIKEIKGSSTQYLFTEGKDISYILNPSKVNERYN